MARLSRAMALGFIVSSISGSVLYDHDKIGAVMAWLGMEPPVRALTMKIPLVLNLFTGIACLFVCLRMTEAGQTRAASAGGAPFLQEVRSAFRSIGETARWIWRTPAAFALLLFGLVFDSIIRLFLTVASNFYRLVGITEAWYGVIGTVASLLGLLTAGLMERLSVRYTAMKNFAWLAVVVFISLQFAAHPQPGWAGVALVLPLMLGMRFVHFFLSHYLNAVVESERRATTLSFRGLTMNLAYGVMTLLFGWHGHWLEGRLSLPAEDPRVFAASLTWWPWWFLGTFIVALVWMRWRRTASLP